MRLTSVVESLMDRGWPWCIPKLKNSYDNSSEILNHLKEILNPGKMVYEFFLASHLSYDDNFAQFCRGLQPPPYFTGFITSLV